METENNLDKVKSVEPTFDLLQEYQMLYKKALAVNNLDLAHNILTSIQYFEE